MLRLSNAFKANLSGGEKMRICLARACFSEAGVLLFDDPFGCVDANVAQHLLHHCFLDLLQSRTRIIVTHSPEMFSGTGARFFICEEDVLKEVSCDFIHEEKGSRVDGLDSAVTSSTKELGPADVLTKSEGKQTGKIQRYVLFVYLYSVGRWMIFVILLSLLLMQSSKNLNDFWLAKWCSDFHFNHEKDLEFLQVLGYLTLSNVFFTLLRSFSFAYGGLTSARRLFDSLCFSVLRSQMSFFDSHPPGRILNRFSADISTIDESIPFIVNILLAQLFGLAGSIITIVLTDYFVLIAILPIVILYWVLQGRYRVTSRELKRLESSSKSPVFSQFSEAVDGAIYIRSFGQRARFLEKFESIVAKNQSISFAAAGCGKWLDFRLQILALGFVSFIAFSASLQHIFFASREPALVGLAITYALPITGTLGGIIWSFTESEREMIAVERVIEYSKESNSDSCGGVVNHPLPPKLPSFFAIDFEDVSFSYPSRSTLALEKISFSISEGEKFGIVGQTGSGKSSIMQLLFRIREKIAGTIRIHGIDISSVSCEWLQERLSIITQDPLISKGSVREIIDPHSKFDDSLLKNILTQVNLHQRFPCLDDKIATGGANMSSGERQLLNLCRILLDPKSIICLDEATAHLDPETDALIQEIVSKEFASHTVLVIAHRLKNVVNCDQIIVLKQGQIIERGNPRLLLDQEDSYFRNLWLQQL
jgi:ATP-binding cassette subfamily C (CFTR/MRP) protein 10